MWFLLACSWTMVSSIIVLLPVLVSLVFLLRFYLKRRTRRSYPELCAHLKNGRPSCIVGFFHPYCNAGGGGERVLWTAIRALQNKYKDFRCVIYTGDTDASGEEILTRATHRFNISLPRTGANDVQFIFLRKRSWIEASAYPVVTLLGQSMGSLVLGMEALVKFCPDVYIDTMGYAFTIPLFRFLGGARVGCYVHYPTISTDMLQRVADRSASYNNTSIISRSPTLSYIKLVYYKIFAIIYGLMGRCSSVIMVNSTWTHGHIISLWKSPSKTNIVYPPCDVDEFLKIPISNDTKKHPRSIVSIGQFRPEKDHPLQIRSYARFLELVPDEDRALYQLVLVGGCRDTGDEERVANLRTLCEDLNITNSVVFKLNVSFSQLKKCLEEGTIGLHTMWNEHFGIGVVECMAGGTVMLAHKSGGPKLDIVKEYNGHKTGYLADDVETFAKAMLDIFTLSSLERLTILDNARESVARFSETEFESAFLSSTEQLFS